MKFSISTAEKNICILHGEVFVMVRTLSSFSSIYDVTHLLLKIRSFELLSPPIEYTEKMRSILLTPYPEVLVNTQQAVNRFRHD